MKLSIMKKPKYRLTIYPSLKKEDKIFWMVWKINPINKGLEWVCNTIIDE